ncbi:MAG: hypothetical protein ACRC1H_00350, partial [Caldilineaceae bacterium]
MRLNPTRSFAVGLVTNGALYIIMRLLLWAWCVAPLAVVPALGLLALNAVAFAAIARTVGQRFLPAIKADVARKPVTEVALGAMIVFGLLLVLAALFGWGSFWTIIALVVAAPGVGAIVEPWMTRYHNRKVQDLTSPGSTPPSSPAARQTAPVAPMTAQVRQAPVAPVQAN